MFAKGSFLMDFFSISIFYSLAFCFSIMLSPCFEVLFFILIYPNLFLVFKKCNPAERKLVKGYFSFLFCVTGEYESHF